MAAKAISSYACVIENCRYPGGSLVAVVTCLTGNNVICRLAGGVEPVMTGATWFINRGMVHVRNGAPRRSKMTVRTKLRA
jgi:hypothetical protein